MIRLLAFGMLLIFPATSEAQSPPIAEQIAKTYGLDSFGQIEAIRYTWNAEFPGAKLSHMCEWNPKTDMVSYEGKDKEGKPVKVSYQRSQLSSQSDAIKNEIDPAFSNGQYWTLLPFHLLWDGATVTDEGQQKRPTGDATAQKVVFKYPSEGGYQPGDTWELRWRRQANRGDRLPPRRCQPAPPRERNLLGLQEGWPAPDFNGSSRD